MGDGRILFERERQDLAQVIEATYLRKNTNTAGGNFSFKTADKNGKEYLIMTPSMMSETYLGRVSAAQILVVDPQTRQIVAGDGHLTREINLHLACYEANTNIKCCFHAHAPNAMFWATSHLNMPNLTEATQKVKFIEVLDFEPNCSIELAQLVGDKIKADQSLPKEYLLDSHGVLILTPGADGMEALHKALQILDTVEWNADIAFKQTVFQQLGILDGFYSKGIKIGDINGLKQGKAIYNRIKGDMGGD